MVVSACGNKDQGTSGGARTASVVASCDQRVMQKTQAVQTCIEYVGSAWTKKEVQARCGLDGQTFIEGPCPTEQVVLTCLQLGGEPMEAHLRMWGDLEKARKACNDVGKPQ